MSATRNKTTKDAHRPYETFESTGEPAEFAYVRFDSVRADYPPAHTEMILVQKKCSPHSMPLRFKSRVPISSCACHQLFFRDLVVSVTVSEPATVTMTVTYKIEAAKWIPEYDIRVNPREQMLEVMLLLNRKWVDNF